jgi:drug/metabolite transporter (DMT)-like permease
MFFLDGYSINQILSKGSRPEWLETNYETIGAYLGRVNLISTFPSVLALVSLVIAAMGILQRHSNDSFIARRREIYSFLLLAIVTTMVGYFWFLIMYPKIGKGDTIKATYVLQVFPFIAILVGILLEHVKKRSQFLYRLILGGLCFSFVHNIFAMLTHYQLYHLL